MFKQKQIISYNEDSFETSYLPSSIERITNSHCVAFWRDLVTDHKTS